MKLRQIAARIKRLEALERRLAKEIATQRGGPWFNEVAVQRRDYVSALLEAKTALGKARDALMKAAQRLEGRPLAGTFSNPVHKPLNRRGQFMAASAELSVSTKP